MLDNHLGGSTLAMAANPSWTPAADEVQSRVKEAAGRALAEAEERRRVSAVPKAPAEVDGRNGPEPVRYGDWETKGLACDF